MTYPKKPSTATNHNEPRHMKINHKGNPSTEAKRSQEYRILAEAWSQANGIDILNASRNQVKAGRVTKCLGIWFLILTSLIYIITSFALAMVILMVAIASVFANYYLARRVSKKQRMIIEKFKTDIYNFTRAFEFEEYLEDSQDIWASTSKMREECINEIVKAKEEIIQFENSGESTLEEWNSFRNRMAALKPFGVSLTESDYDSMARGQKCGGSPVI